MENNNIANLKDIFTEDLLKQAEDILKELKCRGYKVPNINNIKKISNNSKASPTTKRITLNLDCKKIFDEKDLQELEIFLNGFTKAEINEFYNQVSESKDENIKLYGSKNDFIGIVINLKKAKMRGLAFSRNYE